MGSSPSLRSSSVTHSWGEGGKVKIEDVFGERMFGKRAQRMYLTPQVYSEMEECVRLHKPVSKELADGFASGLMRWALSLGATHFTHWFTPLLANAGSASKHDSFLKRSGDHVISSFSGKMLTQGEPDGSSLPSGGLRDTHEARGYTIWDPSSPPFLIDHGMGSTLYVPSVFVSWRGDPLDEKTPLLRSTEAMNREALRLLEAAGLGSADEHQYVQSNAGIEQEFFLVDSRATAQRPDLVQCGRTLVGAAPPKGQELCDHYFTDLSERTMQVVNEAEVELWRLAIPQTTRHKEVAPGQHEVAPMFQAVSVACDQNLLAMEVFKRVAHRHGMEVLFHEKPFARINGSGKHLNFSLGSELGLFFEPGEQPHLNLRFMLFVAATLRAVDTHQDLLRIAVASASNDHRMGAQEAPPCIISIYLGDDVLAAVERFVADDRTPFDAEPSLDLGFSCVPSFERHSTDRNRTSPFAFTGNRFEFRGVGSNQAPHRAYFLNAAMAESFRALADEIETTVAADGATSREDALRAVVRRALAKHMRIVFHGNGYEPAWQQEAERRGLLNLRTAPDAFALLDTEKNRALFTSLGIFNERTIAARAKVWNEQYAQQLSIEARCLINMCQLDIMSAARESQRRLGESIERARAAGADISDGQANRLQHITDSIGALIERIDALANVLGQVEQAGGAPQQARLAADLIVPELLNTRVIVDHLEGICEPDTWRLPSYHDILHSGQLTKD
jgi:glutamine synthetase